jgi:uncharacterized protein YlxW (UPF0749 family)
LVGTPECGFLIDDLHRGNDALQTERADLRRLRGQLLSGQSGAADLALTDEAVRLRALEGRAPVQGPGVVLVVDATGRSVLDVQDALNNLQAGGAEAIDMNQRRVVTGVAITQTSEGVAIDGAMLVPPWRFTLIGDVNRLVPVSDLMTKQLRADRRVRRAT